MSAQILTLDGRPAPANDHDPAPQRQSVLIDGVDMRLTTLDELNDRFAFLDVPGKPSAYVSRNGAIPINDADLKRRLATEVVCTGRSDSKTTYKDAFSYWTKHAHQHIYRRTAFTSRKVPDDTFNLFRGFGVEPRKGKCELIIRHIREVLCSGNATDGDAMLKLLAWQIQNIGEPSRVIVIMTNPQQQAGGKSLIFDHVMHKIYGPSGTIAKTEQVLGKFNDIIRGCAYCFFDEAVFAGDRRQADALKGLATATAQNIETKNLPVFESPVAINFWLASNRGNAAFIEDGDARIWVLNVSEHQKGNRAYFGDLRREIDHGGREAFAFYLLNLDLKGFVPASDVPMNNAAKSAMIRESINAYDARKWLEDCCHSDQVIGRKDTSGLWQMWEAGQEFVAGALCSAYTEWQRTVNAHGARVPTPIASMGGLLSSVGFGSRKSHGSRIRKLPSTEECLAKLPNAVPPYNDHKK